MNQKVSKEFKAVNKFLKFSLIGEMNPNSLRSNSGFKTRLSNAEFLHEINSRPKPGGYSTFLTLFVTTNADRV
jgi:hypothetical protein